MSLTDLVDGFFDGRNSLEDDPIFVMRRDYPDGILDKTTPLGYRVGFVVGTVSRPCAVYRALSHVLSD